PEHRSGYVALSAFSMRGDQARRQGVADPPHAGMHEPGPVHGEKPAATPKQLLDRLVVGNHADEQIHTAGLFRRVSDFDSVTQQSLGTAARAIETDHAESRLR